MRLATSLTLLALLASRAAGPAEPVALAYEIRSEGKRVGEMHVEVARQPGTDGPSETIRTSTRISVEALFITLFSLEAEELIGRDEGGLRRTRGRIVVDGRETRFSGERTSGGFAFDVEDEGGIREIEFARTDYDLTSADPVLAHLERGAPVSLRVLDLDRLEVVTREFEWLRDEELHLGGRLESCHVVRFDDGRASGLRFYAQGEDDLLIREEGRDEDGPYSIDLR